ncbi:anti-sigma factor family protein [Cryptosporangium phraense]|uniref:Anti-sigma factor n=1 Tax=Cryptosporangium phraense TaxID=2593070 RepID=A0A545AMW3_9ACTN|nr:zf-HC2 domain-containing protein [Cryptosporangium phraense]TQS42662.1 anti-sigma factor [Cryptosporangium phraense]
MTAPHGHVDIAGYLFGLLDPVEYRRVEEHLATCPACRHEVTVLREIEDALDEVPPELFMDGPDPEADLLLQRTLRAAREESAAKPGRGRFLIAGAAAVVALAIGIGGGVVVGRSGEPQTPIAGPSASATVPGTRTVAATDPSTGAHLTATVVPASGWVHVNALLKGIKAGEECRMVVRGKDGTEKEAGSWVISEKAANAANGWMVTGNAAIAPDDVESVEIVTTAGRHLVTVEV